MIKRATLYRRLYPHRSIGLALAALMVGVVLWLHGAPAAHWAAVGALLVWPHVAYGMARLSPVPYRVERRSLVVDAVLAGACLPLMAFSLLPSAVLVLVVMFDRINLGLRRLWLDSALGLAAGALLLAVVVRPVPQLESPLIVVLASLPLLVLQMLSVSMGMHRFVGIVMRQNEALEQAQRTDQQTSLYSRAHWLTLAEQALARAHDGQSRTVLMLIDLDHFKQINDTHGHPVGDAVISGAGFAIRQSLRAHDAAGRYGGDEFAVLCEGLGLDEAEQLAQRVHARIAHVCVRELPGLQVSSSIGVAQATRAHANVNDWIHSADEALYEAKRQGRGQVVVGRVAEG
ncbi:MAG: diguanylate cyclase [Pseudomonadota bacterium]|nr:diguanylate cyclase [Pseudomonadota bacterium]